MKDLEFEDVMPIYKKNYWDRVNEMTFPLVLIYVYLILVLCWYWFCKVPQSLVGATADGAIASIH